MDEKSIHELHFSWPVWEEWSDVIIPMDHMPTMKKCRAAQWMSPVRRWLKALGKHPANPLSPLRELWESHWHKKAFDVIQILVVASKSLCNHKQHSRNCKLQIQYDNIPTSLAQVWFYQGFLPTFGYVWHIPLIILTLKSLNHWCQRKLPGVQSRFSPDMETKIPLAIQKDEARRSKSPLILIVHLERKSKHNTSWGE